VSSSILRKLMSLGTEPQHSNCGEAYLAKEKNQVVKCAAGFRFVQYQSYAAAGKKCCVFSNIMRQHSLDVQELSLQQFLEVGKVMFTSDQWPFWVSCPT